MSDNMISFGKRPHNPLLKRIWKDLIRDEKRYLMIFLMLVVTIGFVSGMYVANNSMNGTLEQNTALLKLEDGNFELTETLDTAALNAVQSGEKADVVGVFRKRAYDEAETEIIESADQAMRREVEEQVKNTIRAKAEQAVDKQLKPLAASSGGKIPENVRKKAVDEAYNSAIKESFDDAVDEAYKKAKDSKEYKNTLSELLDKAKEEINKKIDEEYDELSKRYKLDDKSFKPVEVKLYPMFFYECEESTEDRTIGTIRVYGERTDVDLFDLLEGRAPQNDKEIIIDRMHADNAGIKIGDTLKVGSVTFEVTGLAAFVDYSALYQDNNDTMFDALTFDVGMTTNEGLERIGGKLHYKYAFTYNQKPNDIYEEKEFSDNFLTALITQTAVTENKTEIKDYLSKYANNAINFAHNDMGNDKVMGSTLLYILTVVLAFVFAVTISSTLEKEATVIGTLRASGYTKGELVRYYMSAPMLVVILSAVVGNILGYTVFKNSVVDMYYNTYSLPTYKTTWTPEAFLRTTIIPILMMFIINIIIITKTLKLPPLRFLRRNLKNTKRQKTVRLPKWSFLKRFRLRVFIQNIPNYIMLFIGVCFIMTLLSMAIGLPSTLKYYQDTVTDMMFAKEQVILNTTEDKDGNQITTKTKEAEKFSITSLELKSDSFKEDISVYGIKEKSNYIAIDEELYKKNNSSVSISQAYADKYGVNVGDTITLSEKYENNNYSWTVYSIYDYSAGIAVFMSFDNFNDVFDKDDNDFSGYMSNESINDIDEDYIAKRITEEDITKLSRQLDHSIGSYMTYFNYVCVIIAGIIMYLLTKLIIEKNEISIAMIKILGYSDGEIASLYLITTGIIVVLSEFFAMFIGYKAMAFFWRTMLMSLGGWFAFVMTPSCFIKEFFMVFVAYVIIAVIDFIRIKHVPKVLALKNVE